MGPIESSGWGLKPSWGASEGQQASYVDSFPSVQSAWATTPVWELTKTDSRIVEPGQLSESPGAAIVAPGRLEDPAAIASGGSSSGVLPGSRAACASPTWTSWCRAPRGST